MVSGAMSACVGRIAAAKADKLFPVSLQKSSKSGCEASTDSPFAPERVADKLIDLREETGPIFFPDHLLIR